MQEKPKFICRCSSIGKIMSDPREKSNADKYRDLLESVQSNEVKYQNTTNKETKIAVALLERINKGKIELKELEPYRNNVQLSKTCITVIDSWMKDILGYPYQGISNKYTKKGLLMEKDAIEYAAKYYKWIDAKKNTERKSNGVITGEIDVEQPLLIADTKCSWSGDTFPLMLNEAPIEGYIWQGQGYMELWDKPLFQLTYVLMDAPDMIVDRECNSIRYELGLDDIEEELFQEVKGKHTFSHLPDELRIKSFLVERDKSAYEQVEARVELCNKYVEQSGFYELLERVRSCA